MSSVPAPSPVRRTGDSRGPVARRPVARYCAIQQRRAGCTPACGGGRLARPCRCTPPEPPEGEDSAGAAPRHVVYPAPAARNRCAPCRRSAGPFAPAGAFGALRSAADAAPLRVHARAPAWMLPIGHRSTCRWRVGGGGGRFAARFPPHRWRRVPLVHPLAGLVRLATPHPRPPHCPPPRHRSAPCRRSTLNPLALRARLFTHTRPLERCALTRSP